MQLTVANVCAVNKQTKGIPDFEKRLNGIYLNESRPKKVCWSVWRKTAVYVGLQEDQEKCILQDVDKTRTL